MLEFSSTHGTVELQLADDIAPKEAKLYQSSDFLTRLKNSKKGVQGNKAYSAHARLDVMKYQIVRNMVRLSSW